MSYNFNTIDGLFRPNYEVYKPFLNISKEENKNMDPIQFIYKPLLRQRIKSVITEIKPLKEVLETTESTDPVQYKIEILFDDLLKLQNYEYFTSELDKFIAQNPEYKNIKNLLQYLAELESDYKLSEENHLGSGALGWFLFMDSTRLTYNKLTRELFAKDPQALLLAAAQYYTHLQNNIKKRGGDPNDFITMYGAWWRPNSAYAYLNDSNYDFKTKYNESFQKIRQKARNLLSKYE